ncbi:MAG: c-type cytochrome [Woeseiaceae bacterium]|nr:c-type cytochrome [Woeseiaceae bacterium]
MPLVVALIVLIVGSLVFHFLSPWTFTPIASNWGMIDNTIDITLVVTGIVFVAVNSFMAYSIFRYRHKEGAKANYEPENKKLEIWLTALTTVGVAAMLTPGLFVWAKFVAVPDGATEVEAIGQQWKWTYRLPGADGEFGITDGKLISTENPFGMDPDDPAGQDDVLIDDPTVHIPFGSPVRFWLRSKDVLHNLTVPQFRVKMDAVPGLETYMWLEPTEVGEYEILCQELCGIAHHAMRGRIIVEPADDFRAWVDSQPTFGELQAMAAGNATAGAASYAVCAACHGPRAEGLVALNAPKLAGQDPTYLKEQLRKYKAGIRGTHEEDIYGRQMQPMAATLVNDTLLNNVVAYIDSQPDTPAPATITGNVERGAELWRDCANCHGADGMGIPMNAPRTAGISDWYLLNQLKNFKAGIRGTHPADLHGKQMGFMSRMLMNEQDMRDVVAYINTL